ncbi:MAG: hypothetical protein L0H83_16245, partial [Salinisphaera sp.]|nr:hypothetical protein [Salinisphaera sp.]
DRMCNRTGHYASARLLDSQLDTMETAMDEPDIFVVDVAQGIGAIHRQAADRVRGFVAEHLPGC